MGRTQIHKIFLVGFAVLATSESSPANDQEICSATNRTGAAVTIAWYPPTKNDQGASRSCYVVNPRAAAHAYMVRRQAFTLTSGDIPSVFSYTEYDKLLRCLKKCPASFHDQTSVAAKRAAAKATSTTSEGAAATGGAKSTQNTNTNAETTAATSSGNEKSTEAESSPASAATGASDFEQKLAALEASNAKRSGVTSTTVDGQSATLWTAEDGKVRGTWNSGPKAGEWFDPHSTETPKKTIHSEIEYTYGGKTYHGLEEAKAAGLDRKAADQVKVSRYNPDTGKQIGETKSIADIKSDAKKASEKRIADAKKDPKKNKTAYDDCEASMRYAESQGLDPSQFKCNATANIAKGSEIANQVLTGVGRNVVNSMGASAAASAQNGTLANAQDAAAKMSKTAFTYETALGAANLAATAVLQKKAWQHKRNAQDLRAAGSDAINEETGGLVDDNARRDAAIEQQTGARNLAATAAMKTAVTAAQSIAGAIVAKKNQKAAEKNARDARSLEAYRNSLMYQDDPNPLFPLNGNGNEFDPNQLSATESNLSTSDGGAVDTTNLDGPMLGNGNDLGGASDAVDAPKAGTFKSGAERGPGGPGGGGVAGGGGGSSGGPSGQDEPKAAYASEFSAKERYESAGGAGGGKGGAKAKDDGGVDLNGLLAQFLPKGEEDMGPKNGILDSVAFGGARNLANDEAPSYLDKNADLFQRIHETMSEKNRRGQLGI